MMLRKLGALSQPICCMSLRTVISKLLSKADFSTNSSFVGFMHVTLETASNDEQLYHMAFPLHYI